MNNCKYFKEEEVTPLFGDVFGYPVYRYTCGKSGKEILLPFIHCNKCEDYIVEDANSENDTNC